MNLAHYLSLLFKAQLDLGGAFGEVGRAHRDDADVFHLCERLAAQCFDHAEALVPFVERYGQDEDDEPDRLHRELFDGTRQGGLGLLRDLHDLYLMCCECDVSWTLIGQAAQGARDAELLEVVQRCEKETAIQLRWVMNRMKQAAPQALVVA